ncbi:MAG: Ig-like domain-containing protein [Planctomycetota bacterium]
MSLVPFRSAFVSIMNSRAARSTKQRSRVQCRLGMESLELRQVMAVSVWSGVVDNFWATPGNWDTPPSPGDSLVFPSTAVNFTPINNYSDATTFDSITLSGSGYNISGNAIRLNSSVVSSQSSGPDMVNLNVSFLGTSPAINVTTPTADLTWGGMLTSAFPLSKTGAGSLTLQNSVTFNGSLVASAGTLINNASLNGGLTVNSGATLGGQGGSVSLTAVGGTITPGASGVGQIRSIGDLTLDTNTSFQPTLTVPSPGTGYGQIQAGGLISLGNALLLPNLGANAVLISPFTVINNTGSSPISGTFKSLAEGASLPVGSNNFSITYVGGDGNDVVLTRQLATSTVLTSQFNPSLVGQFIDLKAAVTELGGSGTPSGTVTFFSGATNLGSAPLDGIGQAILSTALATLGHNTLTAIYSGSYTNTSSTSNTLDQHVTQALTTTSLNVSPNPSIYGQSATLSATVTAQLPAGGTPTGTLTFYNGATALGSGTLDANGTATLSTSSLPVGLAPLTAVYNGSPAYATSTSPLVNLVVDAIPTTTSLTGTPNPSVYGQSVLLSVTVASVSPSVVVPSGVINFYNGAELIGFSAVDPTGHASINTSSFSAGNATLSAVFEAGTNFQNSASGPVVQAVQKATTNTNLTSSPNPSIYGQYVQISVVVTAVSPGSGTPVGIVTIYDGNTTLGSTQLDANGSATLNTAQLSVGNHPLLVAYDGASNFMASNSTSLTLTVNKAVTTTSLTTSPNPSGSNQAVLLVANVTANNSSPTTPTGNITFYNGNIVIGTSTIDSNGSANFSTSALPSGNLSITASYSGSGIYQTSVSPIITQVVYQTIANITLTASTLTPASADSVTFTANVTPTYAGSPTPTGNVTFYSNGVAIGSGSLTSGQASLTVTGFELGLGVDSITAVYNGDSAYQPVTSAAVEVQAGTQNERFINQSYQVIIGKLPNSQAVGAWNQYLTNGHSRAWVVGMMRRSAAGRAALIQNIFTEYLGRTASADEIKGVVAAAKATGTSPRAIVLGSREYFDGKGGGSIPTYVNALETTLNTTFSTYAIAKMSRQLASGVLPAKVAEEALLSPAGLPSLAQQLYQQTYSRAASSAEVNSFIRRSNRGIFWRSQQVYLMGSQEFYAYAINQKGQILT